MKRIAIVATAVSMSLALANGAAAQATLPLQPGETAMEFTKRIDACKGAEILSAAFNENRTEVRVRCPEVAGIPDGAEGMTGGLSTEGAVIIGLAAAAALLATGSSSGSTSKTSTTGTN